MILIFSVYFLSNSTKRALLYWSKHVSVVFCNVLHVKVCGGILIIFIIQSYKVFVFIYSDIQNLNYSELSIYLRWTMMLLIVCLPWTRWTNRCSRPCRLTDLSHFLISDTESAPTGCIITLFVLCCCTYMYCLPFTSS
jgi:hypothetical protein